MKVAAWQWQMMPCCYAPASIRSRGGQASACFSGGARCPVPFFSSVFPIFHAQCVPIFMFSPFGADTLMVILSTTCCSSFFFKDGFPLALATTIMCGFLSRSLVTYVQQNANQNQYPCRVRVRHLSSSVRTIPSLVSQLPSRLICSSHRTPQFDRRVLKLFPPAPSRVARACLLASPALSFLSASPRRCSVSSRKGDPGVAMLGLTRPTGIIYKTSLR